MNELIDKDITDGPSFLQNDYQVYKEVIDDQREAVRVVQRNVHISTAVVIGINLVMIVVGFFNTTYGHWELLVSFIGAICVLFYSLANISKTIRKVRNAFPNERFAWVFFWNLLIFAILLLVTYTISLVREIDDMEDKKDSMTQE